MNCALFPVALALLLAVLLALLPLRLRADVPPGIRRWPLTPTPLPTEPAPARRATVPAGAFPAPTPAALLARSGDMNILLLGTDKRAYLGGPWRTDTIIVAAVRPRAGYVGLFSVPRDLWVTIPGYGEERINVADFHGELLYGPGGGPRLLAQTLRENFDVPVDAYVRIDWDGLERIVDALGGITIDVDRSYDWWTDSYDSKERWHFQLSPGRQLLNGRMALTYARDRTTTNDLDRSRRQQQILLAMREAALQPATLLRLPRLASELSDTVETDLTLPRVLPLMKLALGLKRESIRQRVFDGTMVRDWTTPGGAMVLLPDHAAIERAWAELTAP